MANVTAIGDPFFYFSLVMLFPRTIFGIFTQDPELVDLGSRAMRIVLIAIPLLGMQIIGAVFFQAVGKAIPALVLSMSRQILLLIPLVLLLPRFFGVTGVWAAFPMADVIATSGTLLWLWYEMRKLHIVGCEEEPELHEGCRDTSADGGSEEAEEGDKGEVDEDESEAGLAGARANSGASPASDPA